MGRSYNQKILQQKKRKGGRAHLAVMRQTRLKAVLHVGMLALAKTIPSSSEDIMMPAKCSTVHSMYASWLSGLCKPCLFN